MHQVVHAQLDRERRGEVRSAAARSRPAADLEAGLDVSEEEADLGHERPGTRDLPLQADPPRQAQRFALEWTRSPNGQWRPTAR